MSHFGKESGKNLSISKERLLKDVFFYSKGY
jgi:hypothetical protein